MTDPAADPAELDRFLVEPSDMLILSILVLYLGMFLNRRIRFLEENYIPPAVTGGLLCSLVVLGIRSISGIEIVFDLQIRDMLLLVFFTTIGLSARLDTLATGGRALMRLVLLAGLFLVLQDAIGVALALGFGSHPGYGLMAGSVSLAGGHGTAIAWGQEAEAAGLAGAGEVGIAFATFGLIAGGLIGGPIARRLLQKHGITRAAPADSGEVETPLTGGPTDDTGNLTTILGAILALAVCVEVGALTNRLLFSRGVLLPGFLTAMFAGIVLGNLRVGRQLNRITLDRVGDVSLNVFLSMSLLSMNLASLTGAFRVILVVLFIQILAMTLFAMFIVFRWMGKDYDACVIAAGFAGLGLGATPVAIANMNSVTTRFGPSQKAFLVVPLVGAFFIDILNAGVIKLFITVFSRWLQ